MSGDEREVACVAATERWARKSWLRPRNFPELIDSIESEPVRYSRLITIIGRRLPVWRSRSYKGRKKPSAPPLTPEAVDPWNAPSELAERSLHVRLCDKCGGLKKVACSFCGGVAHVQCHNCGGSGRAQSEKTGKVIKCRNCRGTGQRKCSACKSGQIACGRCDKSGKIESWIEIETSERGHVGVCPPGTHASAHPGLSEISGAADAWSGAANLEIVDRARTLTLSEYGPAARALGWPEHLATPGVLPVLDRRLERIIRQVLSVYETQRSQVHFSFAAKSGYLTLFGLVPTPTQECDKSPFVSFRRWWVATALMSLLVGLSLLGRYSSRGHYYETHGVGVILLSLVVVGVGATWAVARWCRRKTPDRTRDPAFADRIPPSLIVGGLVALLLTWVFVGPQPGRVGAALDAGDFSAAEAELLALEHDRPNDQEVSELRLQWLTGQLDDLEDPEAIELILKTLVAEAHLRGKLAPELESRRVRVFESAALKGDLTSAQSQIDALLDEADGPDELRRVTNTVASLTIEIAKDVLKGGRHEPALELIEVLPATLPDPELSRSRDQLRAACLRARAAFCEVSDVACRARSLHAATQVDPSNRSKNELDTLAEWAIARADAESTDAAEPAAQLAHIVDAQNTIESIAAVAPRDEFNEVLDGLVSAREEILRATPIFGATLDYAKAALGAEHILATAEGCLEIVDDERFAGANVYLLVGADHDVAGIYLIASEHRDKSLEPSALSRMLSLLLLEEFAKVPSLNKAGIRHTKARAGKHKVTLGWDGSELVEAWVGDFRP